jgi:hypothetical protein
MIRPTALILALLGSACPADPAAQPDATGNADVTPDVAVEGPPPARLLRRMTVDQLRASIATVTGGQVWTEPLGGAPTDMLGALAPTMGAPDYLLVTQENLEPTLVVAKFMGDLGKRLCPQWAAADVARPLAERTLVSTQADWYSLADADVRANLRRLQTRFFGRRLADDGSGDAAITSSLTLFQAAGAGQTDPAMQAWSGWMAVCIAYFTDPDFATY